MHTGGGTAWAKAWPRQLMGLAQGVAGPGMAGREEGDGSKTAGKRATQASSARPGTPGRELNSAQGSRGQGGG